MNYISILATSALVCCVSAASANTITFGDENATFQYAGHGTAVGDTPITFDFVGSNGTDTSDLNAPDGITDLTITNESIQITSELELGDGFLQFGGFAYSQFSPFDPVRFSNGDAVEPDFDNYTFRSGPLNIADALDVGETGIFGFVMDFAETLLPDIDDPILADLGFEGDPEGFCLELVFECNSVFESHYGWIQVTRGSVIPGYIGLSTSAGQSASVNAPVIGTPDVEPIPLPAGALLLVTGLGGLAVMRRRRHA